MQVSLCILEVEGRGELLLQMGRTGYSPHGAASSSCCRRTAGYRNDKHPDEPGCRAGQPQHHPSSSTGVHPWGWEAPGEGLGSILDGGLGSIPVRGWGASR